MKLRQKLAVVMASAMAVSAVPVVTMADSTADRTNRPVYVKDGGVISDKAYEKQALKITLEDTLEATTESQVYVYLNLIDGTFTGEDVVVTTTIYNANGVKSTTTAGVYLDVVGGSSVATLKFDKDINIGVFEKAEIMIPLQNCVNVTGDTKLWIDGNDSEIDDVKEKDAILIATKKGAKAGVSVGSVPNVYATSRYGTSVADIKITEDVDNRITDKKIRITVDHEDYEFYANNIGADGYPGGKITVTGERGFEGRLLDDKGKQCDSVEVEYKVIDHKYDEYEEIELELPETYNAAGDGVYVLNGVKVVSETRTPRQGDLEFTVSAAPVKGADIISTSITVAKVAEFSTDLTVKEKKEVKSGKVASPQISYTEKTAYSAGSGDVDFVLDKGTLKKIGGKELYTKDSNGYRVDNEKEIVTAIRDSAGNKNVDAIEFIYEDGWRNSRKDDRYDHVKGFILTVDADEDRTNDQNEDKNNQHDETATTFFKDLTIDVQTKLDMTGEIKLTANGRFTNESSAVIANVTPDIKFEGTPVTLKVGQSGQKGGKMVISEVTAGAFPRHGVMKIQLPQKSGLTFTSIPDAVVEGAAAKIKMKENDSTTLFVEIDRHSAKDVPATITIENVEITVDRTVPQDEYDVTLSFVDQRDYDGVGDYAGSLTINDFIVIGTPNTEELTSNGLPVGTATFTIGSKNYTVNGVTREMDAAAYIQDPGYTMVPIRYVANAFGVPEGDILFSKGKATFFAGGRTIQFTSGSNVALVNGAPIDMATKVVIKDGRTYAPVGEISRLLGIKADWDATAKVATFTNAPKADK